MPTVDQAKQSARSWWLAAALAVSALYSLLALRAAFAASELVQDDARQHVFWAARFRDPGLFPGDLIANYFEAVAPSGYKAFYWVFAKAGVDPLLLSRLLPAVLGLLIAYLAYRLVVSLTNDGRAAFIGAVFVCQVIWSKDDVVSATPRAFAYPLLLWFLIALARNRRRLAWVVLALEGLFYPQLAFVCAGAMALQVFRWRDRRLSLSRDRADYVTACGALLIVAATVVPFAFSVAPYGPAMTRAEAIALPEFGLHGRMQTFVDPVDYWLTSAPTGLLPTSLPIHVAALAIIGAVMVMWRRSVGGGAIAARALVSAVLLWAGAHAVLFRLHLPARYTQYLLRILIPLVAVIPLQFVFRKIESATADHAGKPYRRFAVLVVLVLLVVAPFTARKFPNAEYIAPRSAGLDAFLRGQPKTTLVATLSPVASTIPVFAHRSVLVSAEHAIAYHAGYYRQIRQRGRDLVRAHLTNDPRELRAFIDKYHVDLLIVPREPITPQAVAKLRWYREIAPVEENVFAGAPALLGFVDSCKVWENATDIVLDAHLIAQKIAGSETSSSSR